MNLFVLIHKILVMSVPATPEPVVSSRPTTPVVSTPKKEPVTPSSDKVSNSYQYNIMINCEEDAFILKFPNNLLKSSKNNK